MIFLPLAGIIAEFNPLHSGHKHVIDRARNDGYDVACVISGNFVQRGDVAITPKFIRAEMALNAGADIIAELPVHWAMSTAQNFALGGISQLCALGVEAVYFGSECGDVDHLIRVADVVFSAECNKRIRERLTSGDTYAKVRRNVVCEILGRNTPVLDSPNDTLAVEYINAARKLGVDIKFNAVKRVGAGHNETAESGGYSTATLLRKAVLAQDFEYLAKFMSSHDLDLLRRSPAADIRRLDTAIVARIKLLDNNSFASIPDISEGLDKLICSKIKEVYSFEQLCEAVKSKRYTMARIRRIVISAFLGLSNEFFLKEPPYVRILGFSENGKKYLSCSSAKPVVTRVSQVSCLSDHAKKVFEEENRANEVYALSLDHPGKFVNELSQKILIR